MLQRGEAPKYLYLNDQKELAKGSIKYFSVSKQKNGEEAG